MTHPVQLYFALLVLAAGSLLPARAAGQIVQMIAVGDGTQAPPGPWRLKSQCRQQHLHHARIDACGQSVRGYE